MTSASLPSHVRLTGLSGLHVVAKTIHCRHVTAKRNEPEWNEHFEFPLLGLDTVIKVSIKCKGKISDDKSLGMAFVHLRDFHILDRPSTRWFPLSIQSKGYKEGKPVKGEIQLTVGFVSNENSADALDLATEDPDSGHTTFKKFTFGRLSLRKSLRQQGGKSEKRKHSGDSIISGDGNSHSREVSLPSQSSFSDVTVTGDNSSLVANGQSIAKKKSMSLPRKINERPGSLPFQNGHTSGQDTPTDENPSGLEPSGEGSGQVVVRLRRRRTVSGGQTPNTPSRVGSFVYTNGITKSMLNGSIASSTAETEDGCSSQNGFTSRLSPKEQRESSGGGSSDIPQSTSTDNRLKRFERKSLRLRDYKPPTTNGEKPQSKGDSPQSKHNHGPKSGPVSGNQNSSPEGSPYHHRNRSELSMDSSSTSSSSSGTEKNQMFSLPSDANQRLQLLSSSSSSLTVSSSASTQSLQHSTAATVVNSNQSLSQPTPVMEETTPTESPFHQTGDDGVVTMATENLTDQNKMDNGQDSTTQEEAKVIVSSPESHKETKENQLPSKPEISEEAIRTTRTPRRLSIGQSASHPNMPSFPSKSAKVEMEPQLRGKDTPEVQRSKLIRRHTVQYSKDVAKFHGDSVLDSVLPPSLMSAITAARSPAGGRGEILTRGETPEDVTTTHLMDIPPRPHSVPHSPHIIRTPTPVHSGRGTSLSSGPPLSPLPKKDSTPKPSSASVPLRRKASVKGMTKLLNLSAQAARHKSSTLPRPKKNVDTKSDQLSSSTSNLENEQVNADSRTCPSSPPSRASSISMTSTTSKKELVEMSREELLGEVLLRNEEMRELREQLEILKAYNNSLLEKVILHCPELLEANNT